MAYVPFAPEIGAKYTLTASDGVTIASFNDPTDPNYCGILSDATGLDSPDVRESGDVLVQTDGGWHGNFYYGRRPIVLTGICVNPADAATRAARLDKIMRASGAMRADSILSWQNTAAGSVPMQTWVRRQQPPRFTGGWNKAFQIQLISQYAPLFSVAQHTVGNYNMVANPSYETNTTGWSTSDWGLAAGATLTRTVAQAQSGAASAQVVTTATANEGIAAQIPVVAGTTYNISAYAKGNAGGENVQLVSMQVGGGQVVLGTSTALTTSFQRLSMVVTPTFTGNMTVGIRTTSAAAYTFFVDAVQATIGPALAAYADTTFAMPALENQGSWASYPIAVINGPSTGQIILTNTTTGQVFQFLSGFSLGTGASVTVDMLNHTAVSGATSFTGNIDFVNSTWPALIKGNNTFTVTGAPSMTLTWRDTWI